METIILLFILVICLFLYIHNTRENLKNINRYKKYRLGDLIKGFFIKSKKKYNKKYLTNFPKTFPDTLGTRYLEKIKNLPDNKKWNNIEILEKLTKSAESVDVALHLRIGDVIGKYKKENNTFEKFHNHEYFYQPQVYEKIIKKLKNIGVRSVHIFYGSHQKWTNDTLKYIKIIKDIIYKNNIKIIDNSKGNPDDDFIKMSNSKIFIMSGGGFSRLISNLVKKKRGILVNPKDYVNL
jgi:hypothetical protein